MIGNLFLQITQIVPIPVYYDSGPVGPWTHGDTIVLWSILIVLFILQVITSGVIAIIKKEKISKVLLPNDDVFMEYFISFIINSFAYCVYVISLVCWLIMLFINLLS